MACPHVSGAAALVLEGDTALSATGVLQRLYENSEVGAISDLKGRHQQVLVGGCRPSTSASTNSRAYHSSKLCVQ